MNLADAFNEWMRRYIEDPDGFEREWITVQRHMEETATGEDTTYGSHCVAILEEIMGQPLTLAPSLEDVQVGGEVEWEKGDRQPYD